MSRLLSDLPRLVLANAARPSPWAAVPRPSSSPLLRSISTALLARTQAPLFVQPALVPASTSMTHPLQAAAAAAGQTRGFKMPRSMRKVSSPVARNTGKGKTARKHSARSAKRRRMRRGKIN